MKNYRNRKFIFLALLLGLSFSAFSQIEVRIRPTAPVVVRTRPAPPSPRHVWVDGEWEYRNNNYAWHEGYWVAPRAGMVWVPGSWRATRRGWIWVPGRWRRRF